MSAQFLKDKAREISYALTRVSWYVKRPELRSRLEAVGVELLENAARLNANSNQDNVFKALGSLSVLDSLVRLGHSIYEIEPVNATILVRELDGLNTAILRQGLRLGSAERPQDKSGNAAMMEDLSDFETIFKVKNLETGNEVGEETKDAKLEGNNGINTVSLREISRSETIQNNSAINTAIRQSAIINRIKQGNPSTGSGQVGCRLKDLIFEFPDISERTLRYDLQRLCEQGVIERVGNGGPSNYYRATEGIAVTRLG